MKVPKVDEEIELQDDLIKSKITLPGGKLLPYLLSPPFWTHNFTNIPDFRFPDIYHYLVGKDGYDEACLRSYIISVPVLQFLSQRFQYIEYCHQTS